MSFDLFPTSQYRPDELDKCFEDYLIYLFECFDRYKGISQGSKNRTLVLAGRGIPPVLPTDPRLSLPPSTTSSSSLTSSMTKNAEYVRAVLRLEKETRAAEAQAKRAKRTAKEAKHAGTAAPALESEQNATQFHSKI